MALDMTQFGKTPSLEIMHAYGIVRRAKMFAETSRGRVYTVDPNPLSEEKPDVYNEVIDLLDVMVAYGVARRYPSNKYDVYAF